MTYHQLGGLRIRRNMVELVSKCKMYAPICMQHKDTIQKIVIQNDKWLNIVPFLWKGITIGTLQFTVNLNLIMRYCSLQYLIIDKLYVFRLRDKTILNLSSTVDFYLRFGIHVCKIRIYEPNKGILAKTDLTYTALTFIIAMATCKSSAWRSLLHFDILSFAFFRIRFFMLVKLLGTFCPTR